MHYYDNKYDINILNYNHMEKRTALPVIAANANGLEIYLIRALEIYVSENQEPE